ncbi:hypothetical protein SOVF_127040 [Spinacia oleracea]|nr:hypothetical protein SOVF_127040 [Spinacia oleracea]
MTKLESLAFANNVKDHRNVGLTSSLEEFRHSTFVLVET